MKNNLYTTGVGLLCLLFIAACTPTKKNANEFQIPLNENWELFSSDQASATGEQISSADFQPEQYYPISIPATVMSGLIQNGYYPDTYYGGQLEEIEREIFEHPWWYRKTFHMENTSQKNYHLRFKGINYRADIWLNGRLLASDELIEGPFGMWHLDATNYIQSGQNVLAVKVSPPQSGDLTIGFVDWSPEAPDKNMGLWRGVYLRETGRVSLLHPHVATRVNTETLDEAWVAISVTAQNHADHSQDITVKATFDNVSLSQKVSLKAHQEKEVVFTPDAFTELHRKNPKLWWPVNLGDPHLYTMHISAEADKNVLDLKEFRFGIRQIDQYRNEDDHLGFTVNGQKLLIKGGGWVDDMLLADPDEKVIAQVDYVKHINMNTIRLEGFWGKNKTLYDRCDEQGVLLMIGWSCQWEWEYYSGRPEDDFMAIRDPGEQEQQARAYVDQVLWLRNHPSVFLWNFGSDKLPPVELEVLLNKYMARADTTRPLLSHCGSSVSEFSGTSGVKMHGPYDWVSPNYWYIDDQYGGAYGFNTETGPGPQIPTLESIQRMIPEEDLWPRGDMWDYHSGRFEFHNIDRFLTAFNARYGEESTLEGFIFKNQISNYEAIRPMFEAFAANKYHSTGIIQWMLNSAWPKIIWQLYDYYLVPNAAFYGTKKACAPLVPIYNYGTHSIHVNNEFLQPKQNLRLHARVFDKHSKLLWEDKTSLDMPANKAIEVMEIPDIKNLTHTYFLDLRLLDNDGSEIENNFYWLSTQKDTHDWEKTTWVYTAGLEYADLTGINDMAKAHVDLTYQIQRQGEDYLVTADLQNTSDVIAFFMELRVIDKTTGYTVVPVFWDDNYVSLLPGENRSLQARIPAHLAEQGNLQFKAEGWNVSFSL